MKSFYGDEELEGEEDEARAEDKQVVKRHIKLLAEIDDIESERECRDIDGKWVEELGEGSCLVELKLPSEDSDGELIVRDKKVEEKQKRPKGR